MTSGRDKAKLYEDLAGQCHAAQDSLQRDIFLVLAADSALASGQAERAERLRARLVELSPYTLLRPFNSFAQALESADIQHYVNDLRRRYPPETAACLLVDPVNGVSAADFPEIFAAPVQPETFPLYESHASLVAPFHPTAVDPLPAPLMPPVSQPAAPPVSKPRRRSPYENPDYGPRVPTGPAQQEFVGAWIIYLLVGLIGLLGLLACGYFILRPILQQ